MIQIWGATLANGGWRCLGHSESGTSPHGTRTTKETGYLCSKVLNLIGQSDAVGSLYLCEFLSVSPL